MKINRFVPDTRIFEKMAEKKDISPVNDNSDFFSTLKGKLDEVNDKQIQADKSTEDFVMGKGKDIHEVMLDTEEAKMSLQLAVQVRNKIVEAYQEFNRMQI